MMDRRQNAFAGSVALAALCCFASAAAAQSVTRPTVDAPSIAKPDAPKAPNLAPPKLPEPPGGGGVLNRIRALEAEAKKNTVEPIDLPKLLNRMGVRAKPKTTIIQSGNIPLPTKSPRDSDR